MTSLVQRLRTHNGKKNFKKFLTHAVPSPTYVEPWKWEWIYCDYDSFIAKNYTMEMIEEKQEDKPWNVDWNFVHDNISWNFDVHDQPQPREKNPRIHHQHTRTNQKQKYTKRSNRNKMNMKNYNYNRKI